MIQANELRIGNKVLDNEGKIREVCGIQHPYAHLVSLRSSVLAGNYQFNDIHPIPLTEEVFVKCPEISKCTFREDRWNIRHKEGQFHIIKFDNRFLFRGAGMSVIYVDTLHHLQNLVFVNTGKELEVTP